MKKFICGFISGAIIFATVGAVAVSYVATPAKFKVMVNGEEFESDPPAMVINDRTYLPLRAMGDVLGVPVEWNAEKQQAEVGTVSTDSDVSEDYSRTNPAPIGVAQKYVQEGFGDQDATVSIKVVETVRGDEAWNKIKEKNSHSSPAPEGYEYILVNIEATVLYTATDRSIEINEDLFECFSPANEKYDDVYVSVDNKLDETIYQGGNGEGYLVFCVRKDDTSPKLAFCRSYDGTGGIWFALN